MMADYEVRVVEQHGAVTLIRLNRPQAPNAHNSQVRADMIAAFDAYAADPTQLCAVVTGSDKAFAAGADIKEMTDRGFADMYGRNFFAGLDTVVASPTSWTAAVAGYALGGGFEVAQIDG